MTKPFLVSKGSGDDSIQRSIKTVRTAKTGKAVEPVSFKVEATKGGQSAEQCEECGEDRAFLRSQWRSRYRHSHLSWKPTDQSHSGLSILR